MCRVGAFRAGLSVLLVSVMCLSGAAGLAPLGFAKTDHRDAGAASPDRSSTYVMRPPPGGGGRGGPAGAGGGASGGGGGVKGGGGAPPSDGAGGNGLPEDGKGPTSRATSRPKPTKLKSFEQTKSDADRCYRADDAVIIWQFYVDNAKEKIPEAKVELKVWLDRAKDKAEKIGKNWVGGTDLDKIHNDFKEKFEKAVTAIKGNQLLVGLKLLEEADKIYPNSYEAKFLIGFYQIWRFNPSSPDVSSFKKGQTLFEQCIKLDPYSPEAFGNLGICLYFQRQYKPAIKAFHQAVKLENEEELVKAHLANLLTCIDGCPPGLSRAQDIKTEVADANLMREQYKISGSSGFHVVQFRPRTEEPVQEDENKRKGVVASGSGEIVSADGYIITNRHVASAGNTLLVKMNVGSPEEFQLTAKVLFIDDEQDLALIKIESDKPFPYLKYAKYDSPANGKECYLLGYPLSFTIGTAIKITNGIVAAGVNGSPLSHPDVTMTAKANHGNSGGPIVDAYGNIMAVLTEGQGIGQGGDVYGVGISSGRVRKFLAKHDIKLEAGEPSPGDSKMDAEAVAAKCSPATVLIMIANQ